DGLAHLRRAGVEGQQALRTDRRLDLVVAHERRRAAELAVLPDRRRVVDHHRLAAAALHAARRRLPAAQVVGQLTQRRDEIDLLDGAGAGIERVRRLGPAERADQALTRSIPLG